MRFRALLGLMAFIGAFGLAQSQVVNVTGKVSFNPNRARFGQTIEGTIELNVPPGYHINANPASQSLLIPTEFVPDKLPEYTISDITYPAPKVVDVAGAQTKVYEGTVPIKFKLHIKNTTSESEPTPFIDFTGTVKYQACDDKNCYPPAQVTLKTTVEIDAAEKPNTPEALAPQPDKPTVKPNNQIPTVAPPPPTPPTPVVDPTKNFKDNKLAMSIWTLYQAHNWLALMLAVILGGLALNLTPCVYPIIAITIGFFARQAPGNRKRTFSLALVYMLGIVMVYSTLGLIAAASGKTFGFQFQSPWVSAGMAVIMLALALSMFDLWEIRPPSFLMNKVGGRSGVGGAAMMGMLAGVAAAPCAGPVVLALFAIVSQLSSYVLGFWMFFGLGLGLGLPYMALAIIPNGAQKLPRSGEWMVTIKHILGLVVIGVGIFYLRPLPSVTTQMYTTIWGVFLLGSGVFLIMFDKTGKNSLVIRQVKNLLGIAAVASAVLIWRPAPTEASKVVWLPYTEAAIAQAKVDGKPVLIDFTAKWCQQCHEIELQTFSDKQVMAKMAKMVTLRVDATDGNNTEVQAIQTKYNVNGLPAVILLNAQGQEVDRLTTFEPPTAFQKRLAKVGL